MAEEHRKYEDFEELVFENRNKGYGAYDLRQSYRGILTKAFLIGSSLFIALILGTSFYMKAAGEKEKSSDIGVEMDILAENEEKEKPKEEKPEEKIYEQKKEPEQSIQDLAQKVDDNLPDQATVENVELNPTTEPKNETAAADMKENKDVNFGTETKEGEKGNMYQGDQRKDGVEGGQGNESKKEDTEIVQHKVDTKAIHTDVDVDAVFPGGNDSFRKKVAENFDNESVEGEGIIVTKVKFVVETNGSVSQVKASGPNSSFNREAERAIRSIRGWTPAKKGNTNVRSYFSIDIKMRFE